MEAPLAYPRYRQCLEAEGQSMLSETPPHAVQTDDSTSQRFRV